MTEHIYDVVVVGAGFAGAGAARDLAAAGRDVLIVEGKGQVGGRTFLRRFAGSTLRIEMGGTWILPASDRHVLEELARYGMTTVDSPAPANFVTLIGGSAFTWGELPAEIAAEFDSLSRTDARNLGAALAGLSPEARDWGRAWTRYLCGASPEEITADILRGDMSEVTIELMKDVDEHSTSIHGGTTELISRMLDDAATDLRLDTRVTQIEQSDGLVRVKSVDAEFVARYALIAVPITTWSDIRFEPPMPGIQAEIGSGGNVGHSLKAWILARDVPRLFRGVSGSGDLAYLRTERDFEDGTSLLVGFGDDVDFDLTDLERVQQAVRAFVPDAKVLRVDGHDWNRDAFARGTWMAPTATGPTAYLPEARRPLGRVHFAGGDIAEFMPSTIEGAIESGRAGASAIDSLLEATRDAS
ncbi:NAD(P)/FAD-dependent oxidoreductase [Pseudofrankia sp. BMG5.37]|uniref:flavin monoamine oxidase family protein n=1 Tax=Pseudofrankia sp. BMG5.37 TaxID=3050035 RepID=UPI002895A924|nr:NAD(P)/FAD-dependent oxidoreductase [Pseudofrankia sp. BMG5.37]MDT3439297.1 NAD(P)/FAD-dependent oxidoreductase [Pseudofrankia sp. BMG5.37]